MIRPRIETTDDAMLRICGIVDELASLLTGPLPGGGMPRRDVLRRVRDAGIEVTGLAHWALRPARRTLLEE